MTPDIRLAHRQDAALLNVGLTSLSTELGNRHPTDAETLSNAGWGPAPAFRAQLAEAGGRLLGLAVYSPQLSTSRGGAGLFVSDLWVTPEARFTGLGKRLLQAAMGDARDVWDARFIRLQVNDDTPAARRFYERLGFVQSCGHADMVLSTANATDWGEMT